MVLITCCSDEDDELSVVVELDDEEELEEELEEALDEELDAELDVSELDELEVTSVELSSLEVTSVEVVDIDVVEDSLDSVDERLVHPTSNVSAKPSSKSVRFI